MRIHSPHGSRPAALLTAFLALSAWPIAAQEQPEEDYGLIQIGSELFRGYCVSCHGETAAGDGTLAEYLTVAPADLTRIAERNDGEFPFDQVTKTIDGREKVPGHGSPDMPIWGDVFQKAERGSGAEEVRQKLAALTHYLRSVQVSSGEE